MAISYRATSGAAAASLAVPILEMLLPPAALPPKSILPEPGAVQWDPCTVWLQLHPMYRLVAVVCLGAVILFIIHGLRNRSGPVWLAIAGMLSVALWIQSGWWRVSDGCVSYRSLTALLLWAATTELMFLHHILQRPQTDVAGQHESRGRLRTINSVILRMVAFMPIGWSALNAIRPFDREPSSSERAIDLVQRCLSWGTLTLLLVATVIVLTAVVVRLRASTDAAAIDSQSNSRGQ